MCSDPTRLHQELPVSDRVYLCVHYICLLCMHSVHIHVHTCKLLYIQYTGIYDFTYIHISVHIRNSEDIDNHLKSITDTVSTFEISFWYNFIIT